MLRLLPACLALVFAFPSLAQKPLRWRFEAGQRFSTTTKSSSEQKMTVMGAPVTIKMSQTITGERTIVSLTEDGSARVRDMVRRVVAVVDNTAQGMKLTIDTDQAAPADKSGAMMHAQLKGLVGKAITMKVSPRGEVSEIQIAGGAGRAAAQMKSALKSGTLVFPKEPISAGDTWKHAFDVKQPQVNMATKVVYTYKGSAGELEKIASVSTVTPKGGNPMMTLKIKKQDIQGRLLFHAGKGYLASSETRSMMALEITAGGQVIDQVLTQSTTFTCKPVAKPVLSDPAPKKDPKGEKKHY